MPRPEIGLGSHVYRATLGNMYDPSKASPEAAKRVKDLMQGSGANAFESAVLDAGYRGYVNREMQTAVVLNADVPVAYEGMADGSKMRDRVPERTAQAVATRTEGSELVRKPTNDEMIGIIKARPALATAAPSFKLQFGEARVNADEVGAANRALADAGASFRFDDALIDESGVMFSRRTKEAPKKTVIAYKLFRTEADRPGELFPLFVPVWGDSGPQKFGNRDPRRHGEGLPIGVWYDAEVGETAPATKTGKPQVKSKLGGLAFRPGWHAGDLPIATHIGEMSDPSLKAPDLRAPNQVWAEVEMPDDVDWQAEANKRGINKNGKFIAREAHITDQIPEDGFYRYKTNSNMTGNWLIGGSMKVNRILSDEEVKAINDAAGTADLPRATPFDAKKYGFDTEDVNSPFTVVRSNRVRMAPIEEPGQFDAKPGDSITVVRLASMQGLDNANAASVKGLYTFLSMVDDGESAAGSEAADSDTIFVYKVKVPEAGFGEFSRARRGRLLDSEGVGRMKAKWGGYWYSFPQGTEADLIGSVPLSFVRDTAKTTKGSSNFDFLGTDQGSEALGQALKDAGFGFDEGGVMFSRRLNLADDAAAQERYLQGKAEEAGYADVDEFMDKDYDGFVAAAAQWREQNPADVMTSNRASQDSQIEQIFTDLQDSRGLKLVRANERAAEHPMASQIEYVNANFYDILERLDDAGLIKINCK